MLPVVYVGSIVREVFGAKCLKAKKLLCVHAERDRETQTSGIKFEESLRGMWREEVLLETSKNPDRHRLQVLSTVCCHGLWTVTSCLGFQVQKEFVLSRDAGRCL